MGSCRYCGRGAGWFRTSHPGCRDSHRSRLARVVDLAARAAERPEFTQRSVLRVLATLAQECYVPDEDLPAVLAAGWHVSPMNRTVDHVPTRAETDWLRELREGQIAAAAAHEEPALLTAAAAAALATRNQSPRLERLSRLLACSSATDVAGHTLPLRAWEQAVLRLLGDTGIDLDREAALLRYAPHFDLDDGELDRLRMLRQFIQGAVIAAAAAGLTSHRMTYSRRRRGIPWACRDRSNRYGSLTTRSTAWAACQRIGPRDHDGRGCGQPHIALLPTAAIRGSRGARRRLGDCRHRPHGADQPRRRLLTGNGVGHHETAGQFVGAGMDLHNICTKTAQ